MSLKSSFLTKSLLAFVILLGLWSVEFKSQNKGHSKHSYHQYFG